MPGKGFPPAPTALKRLRGNPGKRALNEQEPVPAETTADPPTRLTDTGNLIAYALWHEHVPELVRLGLLTVVDRDEFATGCLLRAKGWAELEESPVLASALLRQSSAIFARYGIGASDRSRITAHPKKPESRWAGLIGGKAS